MNTAVIVDAIRTPAGKGKPGGALSGVHPVDLSAGILRDILNRNDLESRQIDDVLWGCVTQSGDQSTNIGRQAVLAAGFAETVPATTIDRQCGSSQQAAHFAAQGIMAGAYDIVIAGGVESMSRVPMGSARRGFTPSRGLHDRYPDGLVNQGVSAELIARRWGITRAQLDEFAARSHRRAADATDQGLFESQIVSVPDAPGLQVDETIRPATTVEGLAELNPAFATEAMVARFPDMDWKITPGNSSPLTDGASALLIMSEQKARELGLTPRARFHAFAVVGDDPIMMLTGPIPATQRVLERAGLTIGDIDAYEVNEAFASVPLAWLHDTHADPAKLNRWGGAIALGHPLGATGAKLMGTLLATLETTGGRWGLQTMCEGGGMANATVIERL